MFQAYFLHFLLTRAILKFYLVSSFSSKAHECVTNFYSKGAGPRVLVDCQNNVRDQGVCPPDFLGCTIIVSMLLVLFISSRYLSLC